MACFNSGLVTTQFANRTGEDIILKFGTQSHTPVSNGASSNGRVPDGGCCSVQVDLNSTTYDEYHVYRDGGETRSRLTMTLGNCRKFKQINITIKSSANDGQAAYSWNGVAR